MSEVEEIEPRIMKLSTLDRARLRDWFLELDDQLWDQQIATGSRAGKFKGLIDKPRADFARGKA